MNHYYEISGVLFIAGILIVSASIFRLIRLSKPTESRCIPRSYSFVRFKFETTDEETHKYFSHFNLRQYQKLIFVSEIANMGGHCIVMKTTQNDDFSESVETYVGYHTSDFVELTDEEL